MKSDISAEWRLVRRKGLPTVKALAVMKMSGEENNGSLNEILSAGADSTEPVPFTNGATVNVYDYGADNGSVG